jgi:hypothetical protein
MMENAPLQTRYESEIQEMDMAFLISTGEKTGRDKIINEILQ